MSCNEMLLSRCNCEDICFTSDEYDKFLTSIRHNSDVAEMLCFLIKEIYTFNDQDSIVNLKQCLDIDFVEGSHFEWEKIAKWWEEHKERDKNNGN